MSPALDLDTLTLATGGHADSKDAMCVMEAVAFIAGEPWTDSPECASPVVGAFLRAWNDSLDDDTRQDLKQYIPRLVGSKGTPAQEDARAWMAMDWLVRTYTPAWLRLAGLDDQADRMAGLAEFKAGMDVPSVRPVIDAVRSDARAAGDAAWAAAGAAARAAAWAAARAALQPTTTQLQDAAHQLVDRMLAITGEAVGFYVIGLPAPQGSKKHVGHGVMVESSKKVKPWRQDVVAAALPQRPSVPLDGPLFARMVFTLPRPRSATKARVAPDRTPDLSKLLRSTEDAITTAGLWADDARVVDYLRAAKVWWGHDHDALPLPGAVVAVGTTPAATTVAFRHALDAALTALTPTQATAS